jgi:hypothetical protein
MMPKETYTFLSSRIVKEIARLGGNVDVLCRRMCGGAGPEIRRPNKKEPSRPRLMPLKVNIRHLEDEEVRLRGELPVAELDLDCKDELVHARQPFAL